jgi:hypothetical protein
MRGDRNACVLCTTSQFYKIHIVKDLELDSRQANGLALNLFLAGFREIKYPYKNISWAGLPNNVSYLQYITIIPTIIHLLLRIANS